MFHQTTTSIIRLMGSLINLPLWNYDVVRSILDETSVFGKNHLPSTNSNRP